MAAPCAASERSARLLEQLCQAPPPPHLRARILRRHGARRLAAAVVPAVALAAVVGVAWLVAAPAAPQMQAMTAWQARSVALEATWHGQADPTWLREDARAHALIEELRALDQQLSQLYAQDGADPRVLDPLWRQRSQTLTALIDSRRQGGVAVQL
jgi:hypothetical protein